ncbi:HAD-IC family P-type ATPase [Mesoplasma photuris]|uniref:HAD-IC family P-type ATPase n=1 Tax=Mesoplasma photuris TaxID=217731 RepID=UPI0004E22959|nr:HAD-IC family P-type ATPase [Mesoplasma photuris]
MKNKKNTEMKYSNESKVIKISNMNKDDLLESFDSQIGIDYDSRKKIQEKFGKNEVQVKKFPYFKKLFGVITEPFNLLLLAIGLSEMLIYFFIDLDIINLISALIVIFMIFIAGTVDFLQEVKAHKMNIELNKMIENNFFVLNKKVTNIDKLNFLTIKDDLIQIEQSSLTYGDIIVLHQGDIVPADARVIWTKDFSVDESSLTGESNEIFKKINNTKERLIELENIIFSQTTILTGTCLAIIINLGSDNYANSIIEMSDQETESDYEVGLAKITKILVFSILVMVPVIFIAAFGKNGWSDWIQPLVFALSIAVALTPEALPAIISSNLKLGSKQLAKEKVVIKNLSVVQNMGSVNILATDKTGTLTLDDISLDYLQNFDGVESKLLKKLIQINSFYQENLINKMDQAILKNINISFDNLELIESVPFDHLTRITTVLVRDNQETLQITKGSISEMMTMISKVRINNKIVDITPVHIKEINKQNNEMMNNGFRTILIASKTTNEITQSEMIYEGMAAFAEVLKPGVIEAVEFIKKYNIDLKILTGDATQVSKKVARDLNISASEVLEGSKIEKLNDQKLEEVIEFSKLFTRLSPIDKARLINSFKENHVVAYLGDGVNDAAALKKADVGISVNNATPLAKSAADVILLEKDLRVLENSFVKGRKIFSNAIKYIKITVAANFGLMLSLFISALWFEFSAMSPIQLLIQNLIFDFANLIFVFDTVDEDTILKPKTWNAKSIIPFGLFTGLAETIITILNFVVMGFVFGLLSNGSQITGIIGSQEYNQNLQMFQTGFFVESLITHVMIIFVYRTHKLSFIESRPSKMLFLSMLGFISIALLFVFIDGLVMPQNNLGFNAMINQKYAFWWLWLLFLIPISWVVSEIFKTSYQKLFHSWL